MYICSVYKEFPRHNLSTEIKDHKFWRFKTLLYNHHSSKPGHIPVKVSSACFIVGLICIKVSYKLFNLKIIS